MSSITLRSTAAAVAAAILLANLSPFVAAEDMLATACGLSSHFAFKTWSGLIATHAPVLFPKNDEDLKYILHEAKEGGCTVRPSGSTSSAAGLIMEETLESDVVVVSLDKYVASDLNWERIMLINEGEDDTYVRAHAGMTQLDLYSFLRPNHYFLPSNTAGFFFTLGGVMAGFVHGGTFKEGPLHDSVRSMRVMLHDGSIQIIDDKEELKYWRNSYGLLGIILNVELAVEKRLHFWSGAEPMQSLSGGWNKASFDAYISRIQGEYTAAEFFFNPHTKEILAVVQKDLEAVKGGPASDDECGWNYRARTCYHLDYCSYQYQFGDFTLDQSCRLIGPSPPSVDTMKQAYHRLIHENPKLGVTGIKVGDDALEKDFVSFALQSEMDRLLLDISLSAISEQVQESSEMRNDPFFVPTNLPITTPFLEYLLPKDKLFEVLDAIIALDPKLHLPIEWRLMSFGNKASAILQPGDIQSGEYATIEVVSFEESDTWRSLFLEVEAIFQQAGGWPHTGKYFGMGQDSNGVVQPFANVPKDLLYNEVQKQDFREYAEKMDPGGLFWSGFMASHISEV